MALVRRPGVFEAATKEVLSGSPVRTIKIKSIMTPKKHDRSQFSESAIESLAANIDAQGLLQPIVVRKLEDGSYERIAGFRRLEAVKRLGHTEILARVIEADNLQALKAMLSENTERENLNIYDKAVFFEEIMLAAMKYSDCPELLDMNARELKQRLSRMLNRELGNIIELPSEDEAAFEETMRTSILSQYGFGLSSFVKFMRILDFEENIINALKEGVIERVAATEINKMSKKCPDKIPEAISRVKEHKMGIREISEMVSIYLKENKPSAKKSLAVNIEKLISIKSLPKKNRDRAKEIISSFLQEISKLQQPNV